MYSIYGAPTTGEELRDRAIEVFDELMKRHACEADRVLAEGMIANTTLPQRKAPLFAFFGDPIAES